MKLNRRSLLKAAALGTATVMVDRLSGAAFAHESLPSPPTSAISSLTDISHWYWDTVGQWWHGEWIGIESGEGRTRLRGVIDLSQSTRGATLRITGREQLSVSINGEPVTTLQYDERWDSFDVLEVGPWMRVGRNVLAVELEGSVTRQGVMAEIRGTYEDWTNYRLASAAETWKVSHAVSKGWDRPDYDDSDWQAARSVRPVLAAEGNAGQYELLEILAPERVVAGERVSIRLKWRVIRAAAADHLLKVSLFLDVAWQGASYFRFSSSPSTWRVGDVVDVISEFVVPGYLKSGEYEIMIGVSQGSIETPGMKRSVSVESRAVGYSAALLPEPSVLFVIISDSHYHAAVDQETLGNYYKYLRREVASLAVRQINLTKPDFVLHLGDMVAGFPRFDGFEQNCQVAIDAFKHLECPIYYVPGNHDAGNAPYVASIYKNNPCDDHGRATFRKWFGEEWYSVSKGNVRVIVANNNLCGTGSEGEREQFAWLRNELAKESARWTVLAVHLPFFVGSPELTAPRGSYETVGEPERKEWLELLKESGVDIVYAGHTHYEFTHTLGGTEHYTLPSTTFTRSQYPWCKFSPRMMEVCEKKLGFHVARFYGDRFVSNVVFPYDGTEVPLFLQAENRSPVYRLLGRKSEEIENGCFGIVNRDIPDVFFGDGPKTGAMDSLWHAPAQTGLKWVLVEGDAKLSCRHVFRTGKPELSEACRRAFTTGCAKGVRYILELPLDQLGGCDRLAPYTSLVVGELGSYIDSVYLSKGSLGDEQYAEMWNIVKGIVESRIRMIAGATPVQQEFVLKLGAEMVLVSLAAREATGAKLAENLRELRKWQIPVMVRLNGWDNPDTPLRDRQDVVVAAFLAAHRVNLPIIFSPGLADEHGVLDAAFNPLPLWSTFRALSTLFETDGRWVPADGVRVDGNAVPMVFQRIDGVCVVPFTSEGDSRIELPRTLVPEGRACVVDPMTGCTQALLITAADEAVAAGIVGTGQRFVCAGARV